ncbi:MAG TPA: adenylate/guanylate cyclase domain-containing protein, partial [Mycobacterium sp.]|nr:adenylate/guanylate cyclase domain-containing protein [Mycobacterium sp.]
MRRVGWGIFALTMVVVASAIALAIVNRDSIRTPDDANALEIVLPIGFGMLGALVVSRQPGNALGWVSLAIAVGMAIPALTGQYTRYAQVTEPAAAFSPWIPLMGNLTQILVYPAGLAPLAFLLTPDGRFLSPRWRWVAWAGAAITVVLAVFTVTELVVGQPPVPTPTGVVEVARISEGPVGVLIFVAGLGVLGAAGASVITRLRLATGDERLQLRWVAYATVFSIVINVCATLFAIAFLSEGASRVVINTATVIGFGVALPASFGVALLRYRLYDLDLLLNRTVLYGAVTVLLAIAFGAANVLAQNAVESIFDQRSDLVAGALGVAAAVAFGPMRRALRPLVNRVLPARSRLTLLFTDIVESTQAIVDLGDEEWRDVLGRYRALVRRELGRHGGREVNTAGDAFFVAFDRPIRGVRAAAEIRDGVGELGLRVRTGLHVGEVETRGEQVSGLAVHAAARIMG